MASLGSRSARAETSARFVVVEGENLAHLVKNRWACGFGRNRMKKVAVAGHQSGWLRLLVREMILRHCQTAYRKGE
jgi:hypothetical protein